MYCNAPFKFFFCFFVLFFSSILIAQNSFQKGSYIDKNGNKNEGLIYNLDWQFNPSEIEFKNLLNGESKQLTIDDIQEFEIDGYCKYVKYEGLVDDSSAKLEEFGFNRNPNWKSVRIFLKVLVDSDASLFFYNTKNYSRFFYNIKSKDLKTHQLVYKEFYLNGSKTEIGTNFQFRQQLANDLACSSIKGNTFSKLIYNKKDLVKYFLEFNKCQGIVVDQNINHSGSNKKIQFNYSFLIGVSSINFETKNNNVSGNVYQLHKFDNIYSFPFGGEIELVLPINNNKWSVYLQTAYQSFDDEEVVDGLYSPIIYKIDYKSLNIPLGIRHYFFLNNLDSKIYLNGAVGFNFDLGSKAVLGNGSNHSFFKSALGLNFGVGYVLKNKYSLGLQYNYCFDVINNTAFQSSYSTFGLLFKYKLNK
jgi:hypothetical protein